MIRNRTELSLSHTERITIRGWPGEIKLCPVCLRTFEAAGDPIGQDSETSENIVEPPNLGGVEESNS